MYKFYFLITLSSLVLIASCTRETVTSGPVVDEILELPVELRNWLEMDFSSLDGFLYARYNESISPSGFSCVGGSHIFAGKIDANNGLAAGTVMIETESLQVDVDPTSEGHRYVLYPSLSTAIPGRHILFDFTTTAPTEVGSFQHTVRAPLAFCASANISDYLDKTEDLVINWQQDPDNGSPVIISLCAAGTSCLIREVEDTGEFTFSASEMASFTTGQTAILLMGRGNGAVIKQSNGFSIGLGTASIALRSMEVVE